MRYWLPLVTLAAFSCSSDPEDNERDATGGASGSGAQTGSGAQAGSGGQGGDGTGATGSGGTPPDFARIPGFDAYNCESASGTLPELALEPVVTDLQRPIFVTHAPGDDRLFFIEQKGEIRIFDPSDTTDSPQGTLLSTPFLDIQDQVAAYDDGASIWQANELGLLGMAFHPNYAENGKVYVHFNADEDAGNYDNWETVIAEYTLKTGSRDELEVSSFVEILTLPQDHNNHNGGTLQFGSDGLLYIALGDGGSSNDPDNHGQNPATLYGTLLRIDIDDRSQGNYASPSDNLRASIPSAAPEVWAYGLRNPYRFNFDPCTSDLYIGDVGQTLFEELNILHYSDAPGNFGWPIMEGAVCYDKVNQEETTGCDQSAFQLPLFTYENSGGASIIGGVVYRGSALPALRGQYLFADALQQSLYRASYQRDSRSLSTPIEISDQLNLSGFSIVSVQSDPQGEILISSMDTSDNPAISQNGAIYRLIAAPD